MDKEIEVPCRVCGVESLELQLCRDHFELYMNERDVFRAEVKRAEEAYQAAMYNLNVFTAESFARNWNYLPDECGLIRHGKYTSNMCGAHLREDATRATDRRRYFECEEGHGRVAVRCHGAWFFVDQDRDACEVCGTEFNTSGQELRPEREWEESY